MNDESAWIDNSGGGALQYDYQPPRHWTAERIAAEQLAIAGLLDGAGDTAAAQGWQRLAVRLPAALRQALVAELRAGNRIAGIGSTGWPGEGSIVVNMHERFTAARRAPPEGVTWRRLDDPHYAREELAETAGGIEFLAIA